MLLTFIKGDITQIEAEAIVNAANSMLAGGGGVDGAIHRAAGPTVMAELDKVRAAIGRCPPGSAVITGAGRLRACHIIHAVGPVYRGGTAGEPELLASCYREAGRLAAEQGDRSIAFPAISTGIYGYPVEEAAPIAIREVLAAVHAHPVIERAVFVLFSDEALRIFQTAHANITVR